MHLRILLFDALIDDLIDDLVCFINHGGFILFTLCFDGE